MVQPGGRGRRGGVHLSLLHPGLVWARRVGGTGEMRWVGVHADPSDCTCLPIAPPCVRVTSGLHYYTQTRWTASIPSSFPPSLKPVVQYNLILLSMYNTISSCFCCTIRSDCVLVRYDLEALSCTISISEPPLL